MLVPFQGLKPTICTVSSFVQYHGGGLTVARLTHVLVVQHEERHAKDILYS